MIMYNIRWEPVVSRPSNGLGQVTVHLQDEEQETLSFQNDLELDDFPHEMVTSLNQVIRQAATRLGLSAGDRMGALIRATSEAGVVYDIGVPIVTVAEFDADHILESILNKLVSSQSIDLSFSIRFDAIAGRDNVSNLGTGKENLILQRMSKTKKSMIQIHPSNDPFKEEKECFYQWIGLGIAYLISPLCKRSSFSLDWKVYFQSILGIYPTTYRKCISSRNKFSVRHELAVRVKEIIPRGLQESVPWDQLRYLEEKIPIHFAIYDVKHRMTLAYPEFSYLPRDKVGNEIFGLMEMFEETGHVNLLLNPTTLRSVEYGKYCPYCYDIYSRSRTCRNEDCKTQPNISCVKCHTCVGFCDACKTVECGKYDNCEDLENQPFPFEKKCRECYTQLYSPYCEELHMTICEQLKSRRCPDCSKFLHRGLKCDERRCLMCDAKYKRQEEEMHVCYLKRDKLKKKGERYWAYDFEACIEEESGKHVIYLATVWPLFPIDVTGLQCYEQKQLEDFPNQPVFIFWGLEGVKQLFQFFHEPVCYDSTFFAHNAGRYDSVFVEKYMLEMHNEIPQKLQRGTRIMQMSYEENQILFKDSLCFISSSLRSLPSSFGIEELKKGFFPHKLMTVDFLKLAEQNNYFVQRPPRSIWESDFRRGKEGTKEKQELECFLNQFYQDDSLWNIKEDCIEYCISDTVLLGSVLNIFRNQCFQVNADWDVLASVTLPSAVMNLYLSTGLPETTLTIMDRYAALQRRNGIIAALYTLFQEYGKIEVEEDWKWFEQGATLSTHYMKFYYWSCYDWGCPKCYSTNARNLRRNCSFYDCYKEMKRISSEGGLNSVHLWGHEFESIRKTKSFQKWWSENENYWTDWIPLDPRDAYKGGVSEIYKIIHPNNFCMSDFVSQYPTSMLGFSFHPITGQKRIWYMPTGVCSRICNPSLADISTTTKLGIIKCRVIPPVQLYAPFLGLKVPSRLVKGSYEVIYGLCRECMIHRQMFSCNHTDVQRSFSGTWTITEIQYAISIGYQVSHITECWIYDSKTELLFRDFIVPFIVGKICSKKDGLVENDQFTNEGKQVAAYIELISNRIVTPADFNNSAVTRTTFKLIINALYGKFGQRPTWPGTRVFTESDEDVKKCDSMLHDENIEISSFDLISRNEETLAIITYEKNYVVSKAETKKHDMIASHITAYGRIMLNEMANLLKEKMLGCDTDSISHTLLDELPYQVGFRIGDLELELPKAKHWLGSGRKSYMYEKEDGQIIAKQKGVSLKMSSENIFNLEKMKRMILDTMNLVKELQEEKNLSYEAALYYLRKEAKRPSLDVDQHQFVTKRNILEGDKFTIISKKKTKFLIEAAKRRMIVQDNGIDTLPFGWKE